MPRHDVTDALTNQTERFVGLLRTVRQPDARAIGRWSIRDVARHTAWGTENYVRWIKGESQPDLDELRNMPQWNIGKLEEVPEREPSRLADRIDRATTELIGYAGALEPHTFVPWYCGISLPIHVSLAMRLVEVVLHGYDVAKADGRRWDIDVGDALLVAYGGAYIAPYLVKPEEATFAATLDVRFRGGAAVVFRLDRNDVTLVVPHGKTRADCHVSADPRAWVLVGSGRTSPVVASLRGQIIAWGRKPWLPLKFRRVFYAA